MHALGQYPTFGVYGWAQPLQRELPVVARTQCPRPLHSYTINCILATITDIEGCFVSALQCLLTSKENHPAVSNVYDSAFFVRDLLHVGRKYGYDC
jgi:hypothetical protein